MRTFETVTVGGSLVWIGVIMGFLPLWTGIGAFLVVGILCAKQSAGLFREFDDGSLTTSENAMSTWTKTLYEREQSKPLVRQSWNCKNCGGPNIEQVKCQYCGMVKE